MAITCLAFDFCKADIFTIGVADLVAIATVFFYARKANIFGIAIVDLKAVALSCRMRVLAAFQNNTAYQKNVASQLGESLLSALSEHG